MSTLIISHYYAEVENVMQYGGTKKETAIRGAFQHLLNQYCEPRHLLLIPELEYATKFGALVYPDGTIKDAMRLDWGWWESKDQFDNLDEEIRKKLDKGYPTDNILFEDSQTAVLIQRGAERLRVSMRDADALHRLLTAFISYERPEIAEFRAAIAGFAADLPDIVTRLREIIADAGQTNATFCAARDGLLRLCQQTINPAITPLDIREMLIQHILTEEIFLTVFNEAQFHRENAVARELQAVTDTFLFGSFKKNLLASLETYYAAIRKEAARIRNHHEKQNFLKVVYENFYRVYNPKAADRLGVVYTPNEIVRFMIESADDLTHAHFGKLLADPDVEIIDPATGTGTFITELIDYLPKDKLPYKYRQEMHANEVAILPYYIANLNIEYTYQQKMGEYVEFPHICFVDTLDNMGFWYKEKQGDLFGFGAENARRIKEQNTRKISVILGNPPYNANQQNENDNNKNREYPEIDELIKQTYLKHSTAQKTKVYDMYARFFRWASHRLDENGVIAFVTNNSFLTARTYDGFRKVVADEFAAIYIVDLNGNVRLQQRGNVFGIKLGVAISFFIKKANHVGPCKIFYTSVDADTAEERLRLLCALKLERMSLTHLIPDEKHHWIQLTRNDFASLLPVADKQTKLAKNPCDERAIFKLFSLGATTNRDEWLYDFNQRTLAQKIRYFLRLYHSEITRWKATIEQVKSSDFVTRDIKWTSELETHMKKGHRIKFSKEKIISAQYRPYVKKFLYFDKTLTHRPYQMPRVFPQKDTENIVICFTDPNSEKPFTCLVSDRMLDLHLSSPGSGTECLPLYRYDRDGNRFENITDWGLAQFQAHYGNADISKRDIFHYVYAVLHNPAYRQTYELNLKREFPRIPFYADFSQWAEWGRQLMELHLHYETAAPFPLERKDFPSVSTGKIRAKLKADKLKHAIIIDEVTTLTGVPAEAWDYKLGNRSALEWVLDQYKENTPKDPTIAAQFDTYRFAEYKEQVIDLLGRVCAVSVETMKIVAQMSAE